jgi:hypothetical protein
MVIKFHSLNVSGKPVGLPLCPRAMLMTKNQRFEILMCFLFKNIFKDKFCKNSGVAGISPVASSPSLANIHAIAWRPCYCP